MANARFRDGQMAPLSTFLNVVKDIGLNNSYEIWSTIIKSFGIVPQFEGWQSDDPLGNSFKPELSGTQVVINPGRAVWYIMESTPRGSEPRIVLINHEKVFSVDLSNYEDGVYYLWAQPTEDGQPPLVRLSPAVVDSVQWDAVYLSYLPEFHLETTLPPAVIYIAKVTINSGDIQVEDMRFSNVFSLRKDLFLGFPPSLRVHKIKTFISKESTPKDQHELSYDAISVGKRPFLKITYGGRIKGSVDVNNRYLITISNTEDERYFSSDALPSTGSLWGYVLEVGDKAYRVASINNSGGIATIETFDPLPLGDIDGLLIPDCENVEVHLDKINEDDSVVDFGDYVLPVRSLSYVVPINFDEKYRVKLRSRNKALYSGWIDAGDVVVERPGNQFATPQNFMVCGEGRFKKSNWVRVTWDFDPGDLVDYFWGYEIKVVQKFTDNPDANPPSYKETEFKKFLPGKIVGTDGSVTIVKSYTFTELSPGSMVQLWITPIGVFGGRGGTAVFPQGVSSGNCTPSSETCTSVACEDNGGDIFYIPMGQPQPLSSNDVAITEGPGFLSVRIRRPSNDFVSSHAEMIYTIDDNSNFTPNPVEHVPIDVPFDVDYLVPLDINPSDIDRYVHLSLRTATDGGKVSTWFTETIHIGEDSKLFKSAMLYGGAPVDVSSEIVLARGSRATLGERLDGVVDDSGRPRPNVSARHFDLTIIEPVGNNRKLWKPDVLQTIPQNAYSVIWAWRLDYSIAIKRLVLLNLTEIDQGEVMNLRLYYDRDPEDATTKAVEFLSFNIDIPLSQNTAVREYFYEPSTPYLLYAGGKIYVVTEGTTSDENTAKWIFGRLTWLYSIEPLSSYTYNIKIDTTQV